MANTLSVAELKQLREREDLHALIDVREKGDFAQRHIYRAVPIPRGLLEQRMWQRVPFKDVPVIVYDQEGDRAALAAETLQEMGYQDVRVLVGGLDAWEESGGRTDYGTNVPGKDFGEKVAVQRQTPHLTPDEVVDRQRRGERVLILDSRTREEYERSHLPGAFSVPGAELPTRIRTLIDAPENKDATIVVNCAGRTRSILGADVLIRMGMPNSVFALENGTMAWLMAGYELESGAGASVDVARSPAAQQLARDFANQAAEEDGVTSISVDDLASLLGTSTPHYALDVRLPEEYAAGHIAGSVSLPGGQIALAGDEIAAINQAQIVMISDTGVRAKITGSYARQIGYPNVSVLDGGLDAWRASGHRLATDEESPEVPGLAAARGQTRSMSPDALNALRDNENLLLIDVKGSGDYALEHIAGSQWIARGDLEKRIDGIAGSRDRPIVLTDNDGVRAALAARTLQAIGYSNVRWLEGGLDAWKASGYETVQGLDGADVALKVAKDDVEMIGRIGPLARDRQDMIDYLEWEIELGHKYESGVE